MTAMPPSAESGAQSEEATRAEARRDIPAAARRALEEAAERRAAAAESEAAAPKEIGGRGGKEPVRYGDWEIKGRAIDF